jgi:hypothetical protein
MPRYIPPHRRPALTRARDHDPHSDDPERAGRRRAPIPGPTEFAISLKAYVDKVAVTCLLRGHREVQGDREEGENTSPIKSLSCGVIYSDQLNQIFRGSFPIHLLFI